MVMSLMLWLFKMQIKKKVQDLYPSHLNPFRLRSFACFGAGKINEGHRGVARKRISVGLGTGEGPGTQLNTLNNPNENRHEPKFEERTCTNY